MAMKRTALDYTALFVRAQLRSSPYYYYYYLFTFVLFYTHQLNYIKLPTPALHVSCTFGEKLKFL